MWVVTVRHTKELEDMFVYPSRVETSLLFFSSSVNLRTECKLFMLERFPIDFVSCYECPPEKSNVCMN